MKKLKNLSDEFVLSIGLLLMSFFIFQGAVLPSILPKEDLPAATSLSSTKSFKIERSKLNPQAYVFDYKFDLRAPAPIKGEKFFDAAIIPFDPKWVPNFEPFAVTDAWGYPVRENAFMKTLKSPERKKASLNPFKSNLALAYDEDPDVLGLVNCRENESVTGYFKAYFEDVALGNGLGYDHSIYGAGRREEACRVLEDIASLINLDETSVTPDIIFMADQGTIPPGALAGASSYSGSYPVGPDNGFLHKHIISHIDPTSAPGYFDAFVLTNFAVSWDVDSDLNPTTYDFYTVMYHEVLHALGFRGLLPAVITTTGNQHQHNTFDSFAYEDATLVNPFFGGTGDLQVPLGAPSAWFISNDVVYQGLKNTAGALPDGVRPVYSPESWQQGSSLSHFDMNRASGETYVMHPSIAMNTERTINAHEKEVLCHLGYRISDVPECSAPTPVAENDRINVAVTSDPICINPLGNDTGFGESLTLYGLTEVLSGPGDNMNFYAGDSCSGASIGTPVGARSLRIWPDGSEGVRSYQYTNKTTSGRISFPAEIVVAPLCANEPGEYVCNGEFELQEPFPFGNNTSPIRCDSNFDADESDVTPWCQFIGSPGIAWYEDPPDQYIDLPWDCPYFQGCSVDLMEGSTRAAFVFVGDGVFGLSEESLEGLFTKFEDTLIEGHSYKLSFDVFSVGHTSAPDVKLIAGLTNQTGLGSWGYETATVPYIPNTVEQEIFNQTIPSNTTQENWNHFESIFIAAEGYDYLAMYPRFVAPADCQPECMKLVYLDNISVREVLPQNSVKGTVFYDANSNGLYGDTETGIAGAIVGLFESGQSVPVSTTTTQDMPYLGDYSFDALPDGDYAIALVSESLYQNITYPAPNVIIPGYSHAHQASVSDGTSATDKNFGIVLSNNVVSVDVGLRKYLVDDSLSLLDRQITFRIDATNSGPDPATGVMAYDLMPQGISYYSHTVTGASAFDSATYVWSIPEIQPGQTISIFLTLKVPRNACGKKVNTVHLVGVNEPDTNPANNESHDFIQLPFCKIQGNDVPEPWDPTPPNPNDPVPSVKK